MSRPMETTMVMGSELRGESTESEMRQSGDEQPKVDAPARAHNDIRVGDVFSRKLATGGAVLRRVRALVNGRVKFDIRANVAGEAWREAVVDWSPTFIAQELALGEWMRVEEEPTRAHDDTRTCFPRPLRVGDRVRVASPRECLAPHVRVLVSGAVAVIERDARAEGYDWLIKFPDGGRWFDSSELVRVEEESAPVEQPKPPTFTPKPDPTPPPFKVGDRVRVDWAKAMGPGGSMHDLENEARLEPFGVIVAVDRHGTLVRFASVTCHESWRLLCSELSHAPRWPEGVMVHDDYNDYGEKFAAVFRGGLPIGRMWLHRARVIDGDDIRRRDDTDATYARAIMFMTLHDNHIDHITVEHFAGLDTQEALDRAMDIAVANIARRSEGYPR